MHYNSNLHYEASKQDISRLKSVSALFKLKTTCKITRMVLIYILLIKKKQERRSGDQVLHKISLNM